MWETTIQCSRHVSEITETYLHSLLRGRIGSPLIHLHDRFDGALCVKGTTSCSKQNKILGLEILNALIRVLAAELQGYRPVCSEGVEDVNGPFEHHNRAVSSVIETIFHLLGGLANHQCQFGQKSTLDLHD